MDMGKLMLIGVRGEASDLVSDAGAGWPVVPENVEKVAEGMVHMARLPRHELELTDSRAREAYYSGYSFAAGIAATHACLQRVLASPNQHSNALSPQPSQNEV
ncbi:MAG: hypothetical protein E5Y67_04025 [Mesorhizobium sp.]|uniref:glycosyltransferase n=1 Tax=Mesorhizobium sp. TaxID=1871066 RepID=UPI00121C578B|nr:hypothetical protein [Mesorhizobium sp.]TIM16072.1 MAG: hypothetical protein E5Y67_04025 [Mesorhizobium sp.]